VKKTKGSRKRKEREREPGFVHSENQITFENKFARVMMGPRGKGRKGCSKYEVGSEGRSQP